MLMAIFVDTDYPADSLEFCPTPGFEDLFVCGTYDLLDLPEGRTQKRRGQCLVFQMGKGHSVYVDTL